MKCAEVVSFLLEIAPLERGVPNDGQTGWKFGDPQQEARAIGCTWSPTLGVLQQAAGLGVNFIITHEPLFFPHLQTPWYRNRPAEQKPANQARRAILERHDIAVYGFHSPWDVKPVDGVLDQCAAALGLERVIAQGFVTKVYEIEETTVGMLASHVKQELGSPGVRVIGDVNRQVRRVGLSIGGLGQSFGAAEELAEAGAEAIVFGEMLDYTIRQGIELGVAMIETGHCATENPGIRRQAQVLAEAFPQVPVHFLDAGSPWTFL